MRKKKQIEVFSESMHCYGCNHMASEHESFNKIHGAKSLPKTIYWNCKLCTCRMFNGLMKIDD